MVIDYTFLCCLVPFLGRVQVLQDAITVIGMIAVQMTDFNILVRITVNKRLLANRTAIVMLPLLACHILQLVLPDIFYEEHVVILVAYIITHHPHLELANPLLLVHLLLQPYEVIVEYVCVKIFLFKYLQAPLVCFGVLFFDLVRVILGLKMLS
jgi:hypothetical protein